MPAFTVRKELFAWIKEGRKTVELRKGNPSQGQYAVFLSGRNYLRLPITKKETGPLVDIVTVDNYRQIIPSAEKIEDTLGYMRNLYKSDQGLFTAYYFDSSKKI